MSITTLLRKKRFSFCCLLSGFLLSSCLISQPQINDPVRTQLGASPSPTSFPSPMEQSPIPESRRANPLYLEVFAGDGTEGFKDGGLSDAQFSSVLGGCADENTGEIYLLDEHRIRKITLNQQVLTLAGSEKSGFQDGKGSDSLFHFPKACVVDSNGDLYILDTGNNRVRILSKEGQVSTFIGTGEKGIGDGPTTDASVFGLTDAIFIEGKFTFTDGPLIRQVQNGNVVTLNFTQRENVNRYLLLSENTSDTLKNFTFGDPRTAPGFGLLWLAKKNDQEYYVLDADLKLIYSISDLKSVKQLEVRNDGEIIREESFVLPVSNMFYSSQLDGLIISGRRFIILENVSGSAIPYSPYLEFKNSQRIFSSQAPIFVDKTQTFYFYDRLHHQILKVQLNT